MYSRISRALLVGLILGCCWLAPASPLIAAPASGAHGATESESIGVPPLDSWKADLALWTAVVFLLLLAVLWKFAWKPIAEGLEKREQGIARSITQAEEANRQARELLAQYEQKLARAQDDVRALLEQARRDAEQAGREMMEKAKADVHTEHQRALRQIESATTAALKELADRAAVLAVELAGKILHAKLNPADHTRLINEAVSSFAGKNASEN